MPKKKSFSPGRGVPIGISPGPPGGKGPRLHIPSTGPRRRVRPRFGTPYGGPPPKRKKFPPGIRPGSPAGKKKAARRRGR